jgi:hypothetical protein
LRIHAHPVEATTELSITHEWYGNTGRKSLITVGITNLSLGYPTNGQVED